MNVEVFTDYMEQRAEAIENILDKGSDLIEAKNNLILQKIEKILSKTQQNSLKKKENFQTMFKVI